MNELYDMIFKRKSFRRFDDTLTLSEEELQYINEKIESLNPLVKEIEIKYKIVPRENTTSKRGEYCLLIYSEEKEHYLLNIGYMFEQLDLYLALKNIGVCWYGMGKTNEPQYDKLKYVIMMAFGKGKEGEFRKDYKKSKRKETSDIWKGDLSFELAEVVKYAPSACNTQPWRVICENNILKIYRTTEVKSIMPKEKVPFYNSIDMGIFLYFLELTLSRNKLSFQRILSPENNDSNLVTIATYILEKNNRT
ncbi:nitroreductase family protein [Clostridium sp.]|uniref:nitroreductase family protein n=1 Tax=Clostridium sp. TaxID=1506 RepID=UPI002612626A|nr:nitroreductase family protein [Clostridium sp.]